MAFLTRPDTNVVVTLDAAAHLGRRVQNTIGRTRLTLCGVGASQTGKMAASTDGHTTIVVSLMTQAGTVQIPIATHHTRRTLCQTVTGRTANRTLLAHSIPWYIVIAILTDATDIQYSMVGAVARQTG